MSVRVPSMVTTTGVVAFYMAGDCRWAESGLAVDLLGATVFWGEGRLKMARAAAARGSLVWLDPADYERQHSRDGDLTLFPCEPWADDQRSVGVAELLSPGESVPVGDVRALESIISSQAKWLASEGGGRLSLVLASWWLTDGLQTLLTRLQHIEKPIAVALEDQNDPLRLQGAVKGLATLSNGVENLMVLRCDMGALGAIAHGAVVAAIGTGTSVRHVVPRGRAAGGGRNHIPKVFVEELLDFRSSELLARLPRRIKPACQLACCNGETLDRFHYIADGLAMARVHNLRSLANVTNQVLSASPAGRAAVWKRMTTDATAAARRIELEGGQPFDVRPQIAAWASL